MVDALRQALRGGGQTFVDAMFNCIRELSINMVSGQILSASDADNLKQELFLFLREEAFPQLAKRNPTAAIRVLDNMAAHGMGDLESERQAIVATRNAKYPVPSAADWPEIEAIRIASTKFAACTISQPVGDVYFAKSLKDDEGLPLPEDLLSLYAAADGFELSLIREETCAVFCLLPSDSIDVSERQGKFPKRAVVFQGGDSIQLSIFRDRRRTWWLVYEYEYEPEAKIEYDLRALLQFGLERMNAASGDALDEALSWERFFDDE